MMDKELLEWERQAHERRKNTGRNGNIIVLMFVLPVIVLVALCIIPLIMWATTDTDTDVPSDVGGAEKAAESMTVESRAVIVISPKMEKALPYVSEEEANRQAIIFYPAPLDRDLQTHIFRTCEDYGVDPAIIIAMIDQESDFYPGAIGDGGKSFGLMQIQRRWHEERMERLGVTDLIDPYQNVTVGIDYLAELLDKYDGNMEKALIAYNMGATGAYKNCFSKGIFSTKYSREVLANSEKLREDVDLGNF